MSQSQTRSTWAGSLAGCRSPHGQPWPLFPAAVEAAGSPGCKASFQSLGQEAVFIFIPLTAGGVYTQRNSLPLRDGSSASDSSGLSPLAHLPPAGGWRLLRPRTDAIACKSSFCAFQVHYKSQESIVRILNKQILNKQGNIFALKKKEIILGAGTMTAQKKRLPPNLSPRTFMAERGNGLLRLSPGPMGPL